MLLSQCAIGSDEDRGVRSTERFQLARVGDNGEDMLLVCKGGAERGGRCAAGSDAVGTLDTRRVTANRLQHAFDRLRIVLTVATWRDGTDNDNVALTFDFGLGLRGDCVKYICFNYAYLRFGLAGHLAEKQRRASLRCAAARCIVRFFQAILEPRDPLVQHLYLFRVLLLQLANRYVDELHDVVFLPGASISE